MYLFKSQISLRGKLHLLLLSTSVIGTLLCLLLVYKFTYDSLRSELINHGNTIANSLILQAETRANDDVMSRFMNIAAQDSQIVAIGLAIAPEMNFASASDRSFVGQKVNLSEPYKHIPTPSLDSVARQGKSAFIDLSDSVHQRSAMIIQLLINQNNQTQKLVQVNGALIIILNEESVNHRAFWTTIKISWVIVLSFLLLWLLLNQGFNKLILERLNLMQRTIREQEQGVRHSRVPLMDNDEVGQLGNFLNRSFTQIAEQEENLIRAARNAENANHAKTEFLANMSHELRTPLNAIIGFAGLLNQKQLESEAKEFAHTIYHSGEALLSLINDFLDFSKIEAGKLDLEKNNFHLHHLIRETAQMLMHKAQDKGLDFHFEIDEAVPEFIISDQNRIRQILLNLLNNAIKFTEKGKVRLHVNMLSRLENDLQINFIISDTGMGMDPELLSKLFTPFTQADASITRRFGGTGLGLSICKKLCQALGGGISVFSAPEQGSTFSFNIRATLGHVSQDPIATFVDTQLSGRILLVEDNPLNQKLALLLLKRMGLESELAENGQIALDKVCNTITPYDAILMDRQMPIMDGVEATRKIIEKKGSSAPPIIALTANVFQEQKEELFHAGMVDYLSKPIKEQELRQCLSKWIKNPP